MKKLILFTAAVFLFMAAPGFAEGDKGYHKKGFAKGETPEKRIEKMTKDLWLSQDQAAQLKALMTTKMEKKRALHEETKTKMQAIQDEYNASLKSLLTPEQLKKYEARKEEKKEMFKNKRRGRMHERMEGEAEGEMEGGKEKANTTK